MKRLRTRCVHFAVLSKLFLIYSPSQLYVFGTSQTSTTADKQGPRPRNCKPFTNGHTPEELLINNL